MRDESAALARFVSEGIWNQKNSPCYKYSYSVITAKNTFLWEGLRVLTELANSKSAIDGFNWHYASARAFWIPPPVEPSFHIPESSPYLKSRLRRNTQSFNLTCREVVSTEKLSIGSSKNSAHPPSQTCLNSARRPYRSCQQGRREGH